MDKNKINEIIDDDSRLERIMATAMHDVGAKHDERLIAEMAAMDEDEFRRELTKAQVATPKPHAALRFVRSAYFRVAAACVVCALLIWGAAFLPFSETKSAGYASMFNQYYTEYTVTKFDAQDDHLNANGRKSTAHLIQEASVLLSQNSRHSTREAIKILEWLLDNQWRKTALDPEIHWYLGLAYLKDGQKAKARTQLEWVEGAKAAHAADATSLLDKIDGKRK